MVEAIISQTSFDVPFIPVNGTNITSLSVPLVPFMVPFIPDIFNVGRRGKSLMRGTFSVGMHPRFGYMLKSKV